MTRTVRFCIQCGSEIGESATCPNPDCEGIPNFYRNIAGPAVRTRVVDDPSRPRHETRAHVGRETSMAGREPRSDDSSGTHRVTMPIAAAPLAMLRSVSTPRSEHLIFPGETEIGARPPAKILLDHPQISKRHARLVCRVMPSGECELKLIDHKSTNGTFVNGKSIQECKLSAGDRVRFANLEFEVLLLEPEGDRRTMAI